MSGRAAACMLGGQGGLVGMGAESVGCSPADATHVCMSAGRDSPVSRRACYTFVEGPRHGSVGRSVEL